MASSDVTVMGAGIFGLSIAWTCLRRGARVRVIDPAGAGAGASGGIVGALAPHAPGGWNEKKQFQLDSLLMADAFWTAVTETGGVAAGYDRLGRLQPIEDGAAETVARQRRDEAMRCWRGRADWSIVPAERHAGWAPASATGLLVHDTLSARLHPRRACAALQAALAVRGVEVLPAAAARGAVIWATGADGLVRLGEDLGQEVGCGVKGQAVLLRHAAGAVPQVFADGLHVIPHADGTVAVGSTSERDFEDPVSTDSQCDALVERAVARLPVLHGAPVIERWAGLRPRARSRAPMLGPWPGRSGHFVANGGFKIGFGMAPKVAEVMADLVLEGLDGLPDGFRVEASLPSSMR